MMVVLKGRDNMNYQQTAKNILSACGGTENVISSTHCATRLRLELKDQTKVNTQAIQQIKEVKGHMVTGGQNKFIIGAGEVTEVYQAFANLTNGKDTTQEIDNIKQSYRKQNPLSALIKTISDIFVPIIPIVISGGLLMCITAFMTTPGFVSADKSIVQLYPGLEGVISFLGMLSGIPFTYLPVMIGFTTAKRFGGTPLLGAALGLFMVNSSLINPAATSGVEIPTWNMFGLQVQQIGYHSTVLPILASGFILSKIEVFSKKRVKNVLNLYVPFFSLVVTSFITFLFIGPILRDVGYMLTDALIWLYQTTGIFGGIIMGLLYAPMVITGMHHSFIPIETQLIADIAVTGGTFILPIAAMSNVALGASSLAIAHIMRKDKAMKSEAISAGVTSIIGVSEPALFGINLKYKYAFVAALCGSATGSAFFAAIQLKAISMGAGGLLGYLCYRPQDLLMYTAGILISISVSFILTHVFQKLIDKKESKFK